MQRYRILQNIGDGTYGSVLRAIKKDNNMVVAIKKMKKKFYSWEECVKLREVQSLKKLNHPNIVKLKEVIRENDHLYFVFEFLDKNIYEFTKAQRLHIPEQKIRKYLFQMISALKYMHKQGFFHRDMKPENLLLSANDICKIADFGLAREIRSKGPFTEYVSTRWYRAPEVLLREKNYNSPIDMWAVGCIMAELYTFRPLFPGSSESDQIYKICSVLGTPTQKNWPEGLTLASKMGMTLPHFLPVALSKLVPNASASAIELLSALLSYDPKMRPTAKSALDYTFFKECDLKDLNEEGATPTPAATHASSNSYQLRNSYGASTSSNHSNLNSSYKTSSSNNNSLGQPPPANNNYEGDGFPAISGSYGGGYSKKSTYNKSNVTKKNRADRQNRMRNAGANLFS